MKFLLLLLVTACAGSTTTAPVPPVSATDTVCTHVDATGSRTIYLPPCALGDTITIVVKRP